MSVLIAQLGDIHFKTDADPAFSRAEQIGSAISAEITIEVSSVVLALCGDAAFSGTKKQFEVAQRFIESIKREILDRNKNTSITCVVIPGNHDCDFSGDQAAREGLLQLIKESEKPARSVCDIVLEPLSEYFKFAEKVTDKTKAITKDHQFYRAVDLKDGNSKLRLHLLNTAWMSSMHEQQGTLHFPLPEIIPPSGRADCSIAFLHHPTRWFAQPHVMRPLRDRLSELSSVILVNHEHVPEAVEEVPFYGPDGGATKTLYVSGGVVQDSDHPEICNFNIIKVAVEEKKVELSRYDYVQDTKNSFFKRTNTANVGISENELSVGPAGASLAKEMVEFLDDPGAPVTHPDRDPRIPIRLSDIYMYPDLWELDEKHQGGDHKQVKSADVEDEVLSTEKVLLTGSDKCGRTSIIKSLFKAAFEDGKYPLFLDGADLPKQASQIRNTIRQAVNKQYSNIKPDAFEQLKPADRVVLVDNIHRISPGTNKRIAMIEEFERQFGTVVLCGDDLIKHDEMHGKDARDSGLWEYRHLVILGFGEYLREQFVRNWLMIGGDSLPDEELLQSETDRICGLLNAVIKKQLLPAYPLFLLVILQQSDLATASVQSGSFGKLFDSLVTAILNKTNFYRINIGDKYLYLAALSKKMYDDKTMILDEAEAKRWHKAYWEEIELDIDYERLISDFETLGVLTVARGELRFKYVYFFCFFVAYHLNRTLHEPETPSLITQLCQQLHHRVSAEIVLFLAHLTGDPIVLDEMVKVCDNLFHGAHSANLSSDIEPLNRISQAVETIEIPDKPDENRRRVKMIKDELVEERLAATKSTHELIPPEADNPSVERLFEIHAAYKTIQILGQALRNIAASASKYRKEQIINKIVGLARRVLGSYLELFDENVLPHVLEDMAAVHVDEHPDLQKTELHKQIVQHLNGMTKFICYSMIKHTTFSVGSENLAPTICRVLGESNEVISQLLDLSFELEVPKNFPKDKSIRLYNSLSQNPFSASLVRIMLANHMYLYVVPYQDRQAVCKKLSIKVLPSVMDRKRKRLT